MHITAVASLVEAYLASQGEAPRFSMVLPSVCAIVEVVAGG
jgi:hypothetical protein